jgi:ubiquinone biosynthesis protein
MVTLLPKPWFADAPVMRRSRQVTRVLTGHGLESLVDQSGLRRFAPFRVRVRDGGPPPRQAERLRAAFGELGVTFIKLGQMLSTRADLLPADVVAELAKLQDAAPPVGIEDVHRVIREDLGAEAGELFDRFDDVPLASASIGQVHAARRHDGREVVVKVRRPGVEAQIEVDLQILRGIAEWAREHTRAGRDYDLVPLVEEFAHSLRNELDYVREADNVERFRRAFAGDRKVWIPTAHRDLTSSRVLTLERVTGIKITDIEALDRLGIPRRGIAENALRIFLREALDFGFFHADPHPGNFFVQPDGSLAIVDFGMVGRLTEAVQIHLLRAGLAAIQQDPETLAEELYALGVAGRRADRRAFQRDLDHLIGRYGGRSLRELSATQVTQELTGIAFRHRLQLPTELALLFRVVAMSEGIGLRLDPDFHYLEYASPIFQKRWTSLHTLPATAARFGRAALDAAELGAQLPRRTGLLLGRLERGELELNVRHEGLEAFARQFQRMTNRLALAVILAASVVALGLAIGVRGIRHGETLVEWLFRLGIVFSLVFGAGLLWSMWRGPRR